MRKGLLSPGTGLKHHGTAHPGSLHFLQPLRTRTLSSLQGLCDATFNLQRGRGTLSIILIPSEFPYRVAFRKRQQPSVVQVMDQTSNRSSAPKHCPVFIISCLLPEASGAVSLESWETGLLQKYHLPQENRDSWQQQDYYTEGWGNSCPFTEAQVTA